MQSIRRAALEAFPGTGERGGARGRVRIYQDNEMCHGLQWSSSLLCAPLQPPPMSLCLSMCSRESTSGSQREAHGKGAGQSGLLSACVSTALEMTPYCPMPGFPAHDWGSCLMEPHLYHLFHSPLCPEHLSQCLRLVCSQSICGWKEWIMSLLM